MRVSSPSGSIWDATAATSANRCAAARTAIPRFRDAKQRRRAAKKHRIAAMSRRRRIARRVGILGTWCSAASPSLMVTAIVLFYTLSNVPRPEDVCRCRRSRRSCTPTAR